MEWTEDGQMKVVRIYDESSSMWQEIGAILGLDTGTLNGIKQDSNDNRGRVIRVLGKWHRNAHELPNAARYPMTWRGLIKLLKSCGLAKLADRVHRALLQQKRSRKHNNYPHAYYLRS